MARDYFHFVTKFFEVISVSAPHIYHSALVVSPQSSAIREHYYCHPFWHPKPRVLSGLPSSWDQAMILHGQYISHASSPCSQSFSTLSPTAVEERDTLTLEKHSNFHHAAIKTPWPSGTYFPAALAYSPDGHSLACSLGSLIIIWDIQTGGVVGEIGINVPRSCRLPALVWSCDGTTIYAPSMAVGGSWAMTAYSVASGKEAYTSMIQSSVEPYLWPHDTSLWAMTMVYDSDSQATVNILEIQPNATNNLIESFPINDLIKPHSIRRNLQLIPTGISFCPDTYQISAVTPTSYPIGTLFALDIRAPKVLLQEEGYLHDSAVCFSPDGRLLVAAKKDHVVIWEYMPEKSYTPQMNLLSYNRSFLPNKFLGYHFSPPSSTILISSIIYLEMQHLEGPRPNPPKGKVYYAKFCNSGTCVVTAASSGSTVAIVNLRNGSSQYIDTKFKIHDLVVTRNILLIQGEDMLAGWRLTMEGIVGNILSNGRGNCGDRLWTKPLPLNEYLRFSTNGDIGVIKTSQDLMYYNMETGEEHNPRTAGLPPPSLSHWENFESYGRPSIFPTCHYFSKNDQPTYSGDSDPWLQEGWVKYSEGEHQHQFWLPPEWRHNWHEPHWVENVTTLVLRLRGYPPVIIKF